MTFRFLFPVRREVDGVEQITIIYAGPLQVAYAYFPFGSFEVFAEIFEEAGAFATYEIKRSLDLILPSEEVYNDFDVQKRVEEALQKGDQNLANQLLTADVSLSCQMQRCYSNTSNFAVCRQPLERMPAGSTSNAGSRTSLVTQK